MRSENDLIFESYLNKMDESRSILDRLTVSELLRKLEQKKSPILTALNQELKTLSLDYSTKDEFNNVLSMLIELIIDVIEDSGNRNFIKIISRIIPEFTQGTLTPDVKDAVRAALTEVIPTSIKNEDLPIVAQILDKYDLGVVEDYLE